MLRLGHFLQQPEGAVHDGTGVDRAIDRGGVCPTTGGGDRRLFTKPGRPGPVSDGSVRAVVDGGWAVRPDPAIAPRPAPRSGDQWLRSARAAGAARRARLAAILPALRRTLRSRRSARVSPLLRARRRGLS